MAVNPTPVPDPVKVITAPTAEPGVTTSEYKVMIATAVQDLLVLAVTFCFSIAGVHPSDEVKQLVFGEIGGVSTLAAAYVVSRGIRKSGTQG